MEGCNISPFSHETEEDQGGGSGEEVMLGQCGAPEREREVTAQERVLADLQMREPGDGVSLVFGIGVKGGGEVTEEAGATEDHDLLGHI